MRGWRGGALMRPNADRHDALQGSTRGDDSGVHCMSICDEEAGHGDAGRWRAAIIGGSLALAVAALLLPLPPGLGEDGRRVAIVAVLMAVWWTTEVLPLPITALVPIAVFPLAGVGALEVVARPYADPLIFLFLGGFMLAGAMERSGLHRRLALAALSICGSSPRAQVLAMMAGTAFLSLWVSNTATTMVMVPIGLSLVATQRERDAGERRALPGQADGSFGIALMLGIAFAATIGGMGSLIGTPPNALFAGFVERTYGVTIGFGQWMAVGLPIVLVLLPLTWIILTRVVFRLPAHGGGEGTEALDRGPLTPAQRRVAAILALTALAWLARPLLTRLPGLAGLGDAGVAMLATLALFLVPAGEKGRDGLLTWAEARTVRWDVLILFGGGLALADAIKSAGLAAWIGAGAAQLDAVPVAVLVLVMMVVIVYLGELASNTAVAAIFLPIAGAAATGLGVAPLTLVLPVALAASLGFMLPVATPPNAIVYGTGAVTSRDMLKAGAVLDVIGIFVVFGVAHVLAPWVLGAGVGGAR